jgi:hypothetical protein
MFFTLKLRSMNHEPEPKNLEPNPHPQLAAIRDSLVCLHNQTSVRGFLTNPTERKNLLDEIMAVCSEEHEILKAMTVA